MYQWFPLFSLYSGNIPIVFPWHSHNIPLFFIGIPLWCYHYIKPIYDHLHSHTYNHDESCPLLIKDITMKITIYKLKVANIFPLYNIKDIYHRGIRTARYSLINQYSFGKSPSFIGKSTVIFGHVQKQTVSFPEGVYIYIYIYVQYISLLNHHVS